MRKVTHTQMVASLKALGILSGDGLLVHSALQFLGLIEDGPGMCLDALQSILGPEGTVAVPTFNFAFANGEDYDPQSTSSVGMGVFSEYVRQHPDSYRTPHPMQSLAVVGRHAQHFATLDTPSAFDDSSAFARMLELDFKLLLLGADINAASMFHYVEQRVEVPYRYWKDFSARYRSADAWEKRTYRMFVRDLNLDSQLTLTSVQELLEAQGQWNAIRLNYGWISIFMLKDFVAATTEILTQNPWALVTNRPVDQSTSETG